ncbi:MAG: outer membrane protein assembly factor BamA [Candidatus Latescibacteria bacterium]|nr:outer membrane protein assembly factor BamA [Candidatus Latescibacterota bacterium]
MKHMHIKFLIIMLMCIVFSEYPVCAQSGKKFKVKSISFTGNEAFSKNRLSRVMITRKSGFLSKYYYNEGIFRDDLKALQLLYNQNGYFDANITDYEVLADSARSVTDIEITISEGVLTHIEGVSVLGNFVFSDSLLFEKISVHADEPFRQNKIDASTVNLLTFYADNGYLDAEVQPDIRVNSETNRALVDFNIREKSQFTIGEIYVNGLEKTRRNVVDRELLFTSGEVINYSLLLKSQRNIYLTGLFQSVFIRPYISTHGDSTRKDIHVDIKENMSGEFNVALGYGAVDKARGKMEIYNNNLHGTANKLGLSGKISYVERTIESSFTNPWTFGTPVRTDINFLQERRDEPGYLLNRIGGKLIIGRKLNNNNITLTYRHERSKLSNVQIEDIPDNLKSNTRSIKLSFIRDTRDNLFNSTKGLYFETSSELGVFYTAGSTQFYRLGSQIKYFYPVQTKTVFATSAEVGFIEAQDGLLSIPLHERFYAGGPNSVRGFEYEKVGPLDSNRVPTGGSFRLVWNPLEIRRMLYKMIGGVVFVDVGNVWEKPEDVSLSDLRYGTGFGLRVNTPIGLGRVDYGFNLDSRKDEPGGQFYFSMGQAF